MALALVSSVGFSPSARSRSAVAPSRLLGALLLLASSPAAAGAPWPAYLHDNQRTGRTPLAIDAVALGDAPAWSAPRGYAIPLVVGERAYAMRSQFGIGDDLTTVAAFDLRTGAVLWDESQNLIFPSALAVADGLVVYAGIDGDTFEPTLWVRDAETGALAYPVAIGSLFVPVPVLDRDPETDALVAYLSSPCIVEPFGTGPAMQAIALGPTSGAVLWSDPLFRGAGGAIPTVVEDSLVIAGDEFLAYDRATGEAHPFHQTGISGALASTVAYDAARRQLYVTAMEGLVPTLHALTAYRYVDVDTIEFVWQETEPGVALKSGPAIDADGFVWTAAGSQLVKRDPATGDVVDAAPGEFAIGMTPIVSDGLVWTFESSAFGDTVVYDAETLAELDRLPGSRGDLNSDFNAPGALAPRAFLLDYGRIYDERGFSVFVPEPALAPSNAAALVLLTGLARRRAARAWRTARGRQNASAASAASARAPALGSGTAYENPDSEADTVAPGIGSPLASSTVAPANGKVANEPSAMPVNGIALPNAWPVVAATIADTRSSTGSPSWIGTSTFTMVSSDSSSVNRKLAPSHGPSGVNEPTRFELQVIPSWTVPLPFCQAIEALPTKCSGRRRKPGPPPAPAVTVSKRLPKLRPE